MVRVEVFPRNSQWPHSHSRILLLMYCDDSFRSSNPTGDVKRMTVIHSYYQKAINRYEDESTHLVCSLTLAYLSSITNIL